jgi:AraC-like DNA-binding protein
VILRRQSTIPTRRGHEIRQGGQVNPSTLSSWALLIWKAVESHGREPRALFEHAGLDPTKLRDPDARYPIAALARLWRLAALDTGDPCIGLTAARFWHPTTLHALGYSWLASASLKEALERLVRYHRLVSDGFEPRLEAAGGEYRLVLRVAEPVRPVPEAVDAGMAVLVALCRVSCGEGFRPRRVALARPAPPDRTPYARVFGAVIEFGAREAELRLDRSAVEAPVPTGNAELARANDGVIVDYLARFDRASVARQLELRLLEQLPSGRASQESVAKALAMSCRTLQRKLSAEGTTFRRMLDATRRHLGAEYVRQRRLSVNEIAFLLGFSEPANFSRAFRRWTGCSPSAYRAENQGRATRA